MESFSGQNRPTFALLRERLVNAVNTRINNGEFSERALARIVGVSQPQMHNILKGARKLSPETADLLFARLDMSVLDLLTAAEAAHLISKAAASEPWNAPADCPRRPSGGALRVPVFDIERAS